MNTQNKLHILKEHRSNYIYELRREAVGDFLSSDDHQNLLVKMGKKHDKHGLNCPEYFTTISVTLLDQEG